MGDLGLALHRQQDEFHAELQRRIGGDLFEHAIEDPDLQRRERAVAGPDTRDRPGIDLLGGILDTDAVQIGEGVDELDELAGVQRR